MTHFKNWRGWQWRQVVIPLLPIPLGSWFLYKALSSYNLQPPPIANRASRVLDGPLYAEPVYRSIDFRPSTIASNATSRTSTTSWRCQFAHSHIVSIVAWDWAAHDDDDDMRASDDTLRANGDDEDRVLTNVLSLVGRYESPVSVDLKPVRGDAMLACETATPLISLSQRPSATTEQRGRGDSGGHATMRQDSEPECVH